MLIWKKKNPKKFKILHSLWNKMQLMEQKKKNLYACFWSAMKYKWPEKILVCTSNTL